MNLSDEVLEKYESVNYEHHVDNFIAKVKSLAKLHKVEVVSNLDVFKSSICDFMDYNTDVRKLIKGLKAHIAAQKVSQTEGVSMFKNQYMDACKGLIQTLKRLNLKNKIDWTDLVKLLGSLDIEER